MTDTSNFTLIVVTSIAVILMPGPAMLFVISNGLTSGHKMVLCIRLHGAGCAPYFIGKINRNQTMHWIREVETLASVCTGSMLLGFAGLLDTREDGSKI